MFRQGCSALTVHLGQYVVLKGKRDLLERLAKDEALSENKKMQQGIQEIGQLFDLLEAFEALHTVSFDLGLARGLDYCACSLFFPAAFCSLFETAWGHWLTPV